MKFYVSEPCKIDTDGYKYYSFFRNRLEWPCGFIGTEGLILWTGYLFLWLMWQGLIIQFITSALLTLCWCWWKWLSNYTPNFMPVPLTLNYPQTEILPRIPRFLLQHQNSIDDDCSFCKRPKKATLFHFYGSSLIMNFCTTLYFGWFLFGKPEWLGWPWPGRTLSPVVFYWIRSRNVILPKQIYC